jgi:hypothetical protein
MDLHDPKTLYTLASLVVTASGFSYWSTKFALNKAIKAVLGLMMLWCLWALARPGVIWSPASYAMLLFTLGTLVWERDGRFNVGVKMALLGMALWGAYLALTGVLTLTG